MIEKYGGGIVATVTPASLAPSSACSSPGRPPERLTPPSVSNRGSRATRSSLALKQVYAGLEGMTKHRQGLRVSTKITARLIPQPQGCMLASP